MAPYSSTPLAWKISWTKERDRLQSMGSQSQTRLRNFTHFTACSSSGVKNPSANARTCLLVKFHGQRSLVGYSPWDGKESDTIEHTNAEV